MLQFIQNWHAITMLATAEQDTSELSQLRVHPKPERGKEWQRRGCWSHRELQGSSEEEEEIASNKFGGREQKGEGGSPRSGGSELEEWKG